MDEKGMPKPSSTEDEYFAQEEALKKRKLALKLKEETDAAERKRLKDLHWMRCPKCGMGLQEMKFRAVDADVCFACGGLFLDKGEIEQLQKDKQPGAMAAILNWFKDETRSPGR
jgi:Zn-finger nucleic acid-binding protein